MSAGDTIKFGASTREYVVCGPSSHAREEYDTENLQSFRKALRERSARRAERDMMWGIELYRQTDSPGSENRNRPVQETNQRGEISTLVSVGDGMGLSKESLDNPNLPEISHEQDRKLVEKVDARPIKNFHQSFCFHNSTILDPSLTSCLLVSFSIFFIYLEDS